MKTTPSKLLDQLQTLQKFLPLKHQLLHQQVAKMNPQEVEIYELKFHVVHHDLLMVLKAFPLLDTF